MVIERALHGPLADLFLRLEDPGSARLVLSHVLNEGRRMGRRARGRGVKRLQKQKVTRAQRHADAVNWAKTRFGRALGRRAQGLPAPRKSAGGFSGLRGSSIRARAPS